MSQATTRTPVRPFVGRARELEYLGDALEDAAAGRGSLVLITGEPGIGKTRLMQEFAKLASADDWRVLMARCWEEGGAPAYWPWIQVVRELGGEFERLGRGRDSTRPAVDPESARFALFETMTRFLDHAVAERQLLLIVDDLHGADTPSLLLLRFLGEAVAQSRILVVGSYREGERRVHESPELFAALVRIARRISLRGLTIEEVEAYLTSLIGARPPSSVSARLHQVSGGNPFFLGQVVLLRTTDELLDDAHGSIGDPLLRVPEEVRSLIRRRIADLSREAASALRVAAVIGREFDVRLMQSVSRLSPGRLLDVLAEAADSGLLLEGLPGERYSFVHELVREALYEDLPAARRLDLHLRIGAVLEALSGTDSDRHLSEIAHHLALAAPLGDVPKAVDYLVRAGDRASAMLAYEEAAVHYQRALTLLGGDQKDTTERRCRLMLRLGDSQWRAGDTRGVGTSYEEAARLARGLGHPELLAQAALGYEIGLGGFLFTARYEAGVTGIGLLEEALASLPESDSALRAHVLARLALELWSPHEVDRRVALSRAAIEMARRLGDAEALASALHSSHWAFGSPDLVDERLARADEMLELARVTGSKEIAFRARNARLHAFLELCDGQGIDAEIEAMTDLSEHLHQPFFSWHVLCLQTIRATLDARFADAERLANDAFGLARLRHSEMAAYVFRYGQMLAIRWAQGRLGEVHAVIREHSERFPWISHWREAFVAVELADRGAARAEIERYAQRDFDDLSHDAFWILHLCALAEACVLVDDSRRGASLYGLLLPFADRNAVSVIQQPFGPVALRLGMLAGLLERWDEAERHFRNALERCQLMRSRAFTPRILSEHARMLLARGGEGDERRAAELLDEARELSEELGIRAAPEQPVAVESSPASFRREGDFWTIVYGTRTLRLRDVKGLRYLALLLGRPGKELHALELVRAAEGTSDDRLRPASFGGEAPLLDAQAKAAYRQRLDDLHEDLREARDWGDLERIARIEVEMDALTEELARAAGLGGRDRAVASPAERARVSVTKAIRAAIRTIEHENPDLGAHLTASIRTGRFCSYAPPGEAPPRWAL
jgi:eukaryotic-like serine/threonine-protein kinase